MAGRETQDFASLLAGAIGRNGGKEFGIKKSATGDGALRGVTVCG